MRAFGVWFVILSRFVGGVGSVVTPVHPSTRIVLGHQVNQFDTPFYCTLYVEFEDDAGTGLCGCVLIGEDQVLTAGHCVLRHDASAPTFVQKARSISVRLYGGMHPTDGALVRVNMSGVRTHPEFRAQDMFADVAILRVPGTRRIEALTHLVLNGDRHAWDMLTDWDRLSVIGVGLDRNQALSLGAPRAAHLSRRSCSNPVRYGNLRPWASEWQHNDICAGPFGPCDANERCSSSCNGDSGGPLYRRLSNGTIIVFGVVSRGTQDCGFNGNGGGRPGIYVPTDLHTEFVKKHNAYSGSRAHGTRTRNTLLRNSQKLFDGRQPRRRQTPEQTLGS